MVVSQKEFVKILTGSFDAGFLIDEAGIIQYANQEARRLFFDASTSVSSSLDSANASNNHGNIQSFLEFHTPHGMVATPSLTSSFTNNNNTLSWEDILMIILSDPDHSPYLGEEWQARGKCSTPGSSEAYAELLCRVKITVMPQNNDSNGSGSVSLVIVRPQSWTEDQDRDQVGKPNNKKNNNALLPPAIFDTPLTSNIKTVAKTDRSVLPQVPPISTSSTKKKGSRRVKRGSMIQSFSNQKSENQQKGGKRRSSSSSIMDESDHSHQRLNNHAKNNCNGTKQKASQQKRRHGSIVIPSFFSSISSNISQHEEVAGDEQPVSPSPSFVSRLRGKRGSMTLPPNVASTIMNQSDTNKNKETNQKPKQRNPLEDQHVVEVVADKITSNAILATQSACSKEKHPPLHYQSQQVPHEVPSDEGIPKKILTTASTANGDIDPMANTIKRASEDDSSKVGPETLSTSAASYDGTHSLGELSLSKRIFSSVQMSEPLKENIMAAIVEACLDPMFQINEKGKVQIVNEAATKEFGWTRAEFLGKNISMICGGVHGKNHQSYIERYLETGHTRVINKRRELPARRKDGTEFPMELAVAEVDTFAGDERLFCGFVRNLSDLKQKHSLSIGIIEAALDPMLVINENGIIQMVNVAAASKLGCSRGELVGSNIKSIAGLEYHKNFFLCDGKKRRMPILKKTGTLFPAEVVVTEITTHGAGDGRLFCETIHDITNIIREESFRVGLVEASLDPMFQINESGIIQMVNNAAIEKFGWSREEFLGSNISIIAGGSHWKYHNDYIKKFLETGVTKVIGKKRELPARRKDGSEFRIELGVWEIETFDERLFCGCVHDLTGIKKKERLAFGIIEASMDPLFQINEHGTIQIVNEAAVELFGYSRREFIGANISIITGGDHAKNHDGYIQKYLKTGVSKVIGKKRELPARRKDGSELLIELGVREIKTDQGQERLFCGFIRDLSKIKKKESISQALIESSFDPIFQINDQGIIQQTNKAATALFGYKKEELLGSNISLIAGGIHGKNHDDYIKHYLQTGETKTIGKRRELKARKKDGTEFPFELGVVEVTVSAGEERLFCGFVHDLTKQKESENELKRREHFTNSIIEASHDSLLVTDGEGHIIRVNDAACQKFGWMRSEMLRSKIENMLSPDSRQIYREEVQRCLKRQKPKKAQEEIQCTRLDGSSFPASMCVRSVEGKSGQVLFALFIVDLSDQQKMMEIEIERTAAEVLLLNVLPDQIAVRLRDDPSHIAEHFDCATVLFADIVGFTSMSSKMEPVELVNMLNVLFSSFDELCEKYDLNKVKTIGDCYMAADVPFVKHEETGCSRMCHFALDLLDAVTQFNEQHEEHNLNLRIGINTGPAVGGVVGTKRFLFDLWGDAVNVASRMESTGIPGRIQVTKSVVSVAGDSFSFEYRGIIPVKGKGTIETFLVSSRTHVPKLRRASFYKQLKRLKSFRDRETNKFAFRGKSMHLDLEDSLAALTLINEMDDSDTEAMFENASEAGGGYGIEDLASVLSSATNNAAKRGAGGRGSQNSSLHSRRSTSSSDLVAATSRQVGGQPVCRRASTGVPTQIEAILRRSSSLLAAPKTPIPRGYDDCATPEDGGGVALSRSASKLSGAGVGQSRAPGGRRLSVTFSKESYHQDSLGLDDFENSEAPPPPIPTPPSSSSTTTKEEKGDNDNNDDSLSVSLSNYAKIKSEMKLSFDSDDDEDDDNVEEKEADDCFGEIMKATATYAALSDPAFIESNPSLHLEDLMAMEDMDNGAVPPIPSMVQQANRVIESISGINKRDKTGSMHKKKKNPDSTPSSVEESPATAPAAKAVAVPNDSQSSAAMPCTTKSLSSTKEAPSLISTCRANHEA